MGYEVYLMQLLNAAKHQLVQFLKTPTGRIALTHAVTFVARQHYPSKLYEKTRKSIEMAQTKGSFVLRQVEETQTTYAINSPVNSTVVQGEKVVVYQNITYVIHLEDMSKLTETVQELDKLHISGEKLKTVANDDDLQLLLFQSRAEQLIRQQDAIIVVQGGQHVQPL